MNFSPYSYTVACFNSLNNFSLKSFERYQNSFTSLFSVSGHLMDLFFLWLSICMFLYQWYVSWRQQIAESKFLIHSADLCPFFGESRSFTCIVIAERCLLLPIFYWLFSSLIDIDCPLLSLILLLRSVAYWVGHDGFLPVPVFISPLMEFTILCCYIETVLSLSVFYSAGLVVTNCLSFCLKCLLRCQFCKTVFLSFVSWLFSGLEIYHSTLSWHLGFLSQWSDGILMFLLCRLSPCFFLMAFLLDWEVVLLVCLLAYLLWDSVLCSPAWPWIYDVA